MLNGSSILKNPTFTLVDVLHQKAIERSDDLSYTFLADGEKEEASLTYGELDRRARAIGAQLQEIGASDERVLLVFLPSLDYMAAYFGCLYAGSIAVPVYPPDPARLNRTLPRFQAIVQDAKPFVALTSSVILPLAEQLSSQDPTLQGLNWLATDTLGDDVAANWRPPEIDKNHLAFLQYTSGSTASPKGVMVSHGNLIYNFEMLKDGFNHPEQPVFVSWLPLFHDMGLIGAALQAVYVGAPCFLMSPTSFIKKPFRWLQAITRYKATFSGAPNFAYDLCVRKITPDERESLDLSSWCSAFNGAEPVHHQTLESFAQTFGPHGFKKEALYPCYGLAEATLFVSGGLRTEPPIYLVVDKISIEQDKVVPTEEDEGHHLVGCGRSWLDQEIVIVNPETRVRCQPSQIGEIWISGPHIAHGYWNRAEETSLTFKAYIEPTGEGPYMRTGDLGFIKNGELYITGRIKDLIIIRGRNLYPQDIELTVERSHPALRPGCCAAFSIDVDGEESLIIVQEVRDDMTGLDKDEIITTIHQAIGEVHEVQVHAITLIKARTIHKTSSGKIQRKANRSAYLAGKLNVFAEWIQPAKKVEPSRSAEVLPLKPHEFTPEAETIQAWLVEQLSERLLIDPDEIDVRAPFARYGLDSKEAVSIAGDLESLLGRELAATLLYEYPTIETLAWYLSRETKAAIIAEEFTLTTETTTEPVAIIGIGCRFPGASGPEEFWRLLRDGIDAITEVSPDRWDIDSLYDPDSTAPGKIGTRRAGFLERIDEFDPQFFGISPREAARMDPQQRILMEVAWEALEDAGQTLDNLTGSKTGVFIGISTIEYGQIQLSNPNLIDAYAGTGNALSIAANRISYFLDVRGPSMAIDTACSSSLLAVHLACQSIWRDEASLALAGGVNLLLSPSISIAFTKAGALAPDGRCKTFDAKADGYARGEGAGVVVLKRLSRALADGDQIYAVIRSTAVNQDGRSNGLMAPNPQAQQAVIREAYRQAGISPGQIQYVETHGTGTYLGDPIEANALGAVLAENRPPGSRAAIGSVKTNIGHLEAAAGIAGLIKTALSLKHKAIPPSLHFHEPNPHIPFDKLPLRVQTTLSPWPDNEEHALAGVSSFGFGGTNVHAVLEEAPRDLESLKSTEELSQRPYLLTLSAKESTSLEILAQSFRDLLEESEKHDLQDICYTASVRRSHYPYRFSSVDRAREGLIDQLDAFLRGEILEGMSSGRSTPGHTPKVVYVFSGHGSQWSGMTQGLFSNEPVFQREITRCDQAIQRFADWSLIDLLENNEEDTQRNKINFIQPTLFSIQIGLAALWRSWGVEPDAVVGHSMGELAAAHIAGALSLDDAVRTICERSSLLTKASGKGGMLVVGLSLQDAEELVNRYPGLVTIAVSNSPISTVISGDLEALKEISTDLENQSVFSRFVKADGAGHSPEMDPLRIALVQALEGLQPKSELIPIYSTVTSERIEGSALDAHYWGRNIRETVRFYETIAKLQDDGYDTFIEISPHPILASAIQQGLSHRGQMGTVVPSLRREEDEQMTMLGSLGALYTSGYPVDWSRLFPSGGRSIRLPIYPWQRKRYWLESGVRQRTGVPIQLKDIDLTTLTPEIPLSWLYELDWIPSSRKTESRADTQEGQRWLIFTDRNGVGETLAKRLEAEGIGWISVSHGEYYEQSENTFQIRSGELKDLERLLNHVISPNQPPLSTAVHLWSLDILDPMQMSVEQLENAHDLGSCSILQLLQAMDQAVFSKTPRLWLITEGAQSVNEKPTPVAVAQVPVWGLGRTIALEHPDLWGGLIDLQPGNNASDSADVLLSEILHADGEDQVAIRGDQRYVARLRHRAERPLDGPPLTWRTDATYLITGGLGGLGLELAQRIVRQGARRLILMGRTKISPRIEWNQIKEDSPLAEKIHAIQELESLGASVHLASVDVSNEAQLSNYLETFKRENWPPIRGVFHLAGVVEGQTLRELDTTKLKSVLRPKVTGAWLLHTILKDQTLDFFVLFSSAASILNSPLLGAYAAANAFLDALAHFRRAQGFPAISINWGSWADAGMAYRFQTEMNRVLTPKGMGSFSPSQGLDILGYLMQRNDTQVTVLNMNWHEWGQYHPVAAQYPLLSDLFDEKFEARPSTTSGFDKVIVSVDESIFESTAENRKSILETYLREHIGNILHMDAETVPVDRNLTELGLDSLMAMELIRRMESDLQIRIFPREIFERPSINALAPYLTDELDRARVKSVPTIESSPRRERDTTATSTFEALTQKMTAQPLPATGDRIPGVVFLLSAPRSGSTLLRVMLAGHPGIFSPPELHLLPYNTMRERHEALAGTYLDEGLQRALIELTDDTIDEIKTLINGLIDKDSQIDEIYRMLQEMATGRILIDKSPSYAASIDTLKHAEVLFQEAKYIHLVRHPYAMIESAARVRLDRFLGVNDVDPSAFGEQMWTTMNRNILDFSQGLDPERYHLVSFEELVKEPIKTMQKLSDFLGIPFDEALIRPYEGNRMTDGVYSKSQGIGDPNFLRRQNIDPSLGEVWKKIKLPRQLNDETQSLAEELGYHLPQEEKDKVDTPAMSPLVPIQPEGSKTPLFLIHPASGLVYFFYQFGQLLGPDQPLYALQDPSLGGDQEPLEKIEEYARSYLDAIRAVQPEGPYRIGGWSFGGHVSFQIAIDLQTAGEEVDLLMIIDSEAPLAGRKLSFKQRFNFLRNRSVEYIRLFFDVIPYIRDGLYLTVRRQQLGEDHPAASMSRLEYAQWAISDAMYKRFARRAGMAEIISRDASLLRMRIPTIRRVLYVLSRHMKVIPRYIPHVYKGRLTLLRANEQITRQYFTDETLGWHQLVAGNVDVRAIPGNHVTMLKEPHVRTVADIMTVCIEEVERERVETSETLNHQVAK